MARRPAIEGISVVGTQEVKGVARKKDGTRVPDVYTSYIVQIESSSMTWTVLRRYSSFVDLYRMLARLYKNKKTVPSLPSRPPAGTYATLTDWLQSLMPDPDFLRCVPLQDFLAQGRTVRGKMNTPASMPASRGGSNEQLRGSDKEKKPPIKSDTKDAVPKEHKKERDTPHSGTDLLRVDKDRSKKDKEKNLEKDKDHNEKDKEHKHNEKDKGIKDKERKEKDKDNKDNDDRKHRVSAKHGGKETSHSVPTSPHVSKRHVERASSLDHSALAKDVKVKRSASNSSDRPRRERGSDDVSRRGVKFEESTSSRDKGSLSSSSSKSRAKEAEEVDTNFGTVRIKDDPPEDDPGFGTMRVKGSPPDSDEDDSDSVASAKSDVSITDAYREPEAWELSIISFERGEYDPNSMMEDAWRKYRHNRPRLYSSFIKTPPNLSVDPGLGPGPKRHTK